MADSPPLIAGIRHYIKDPVPEFAKTLEKQALFTIYIHTRQTTPVIFQNMGFDEMLKEGEQALDGQTASNQQAASGKAGGQQSMEDTMVDTG